MEKAIIVVLDVAKSVKHPDAAAAAALGELNRHLADGWHVKHSYGMGGSGHDMVSASLVILEKGL